MRGLALEGGGARGAYHVGVAKAFLEHGIAFDGFVGTSIGAVNAALFAQGDLEQSEAFWKGISMGQLFDAEEKQLIQLSASKLTMSMLPGLRAGLKKLIDDGGIDTTRMREMVATRVDEEKIRNSGKQFGLVTVSIQQRKPYYLLLEDIPQGKLVPYLMASASFPGFQPEVIDDQAYIDGGLYDNCPVSMLVEQGYDHVVAVRTLAPGRFRRIKPGDAKVTIITPYDDLGHVLIFSHEQIEANIRLGYFDGLRALRGLYGRQYYVRAAGTNFDSLLLSLDDTAILEAGKALGLPEMPAKRMLFERIIPQLATHFKLEKNFEYGEFCVALLEWFAHKHSMERFHVYDYQAFSNKVGRTVHKTKADKQSELLLPLVPGVKQTTAARCLLRALTQLKV